MQITRNVVYASAAAFLALFATVFFLLGRESARRRSPAAASAPADSQPIIQPMAPSVGAAAPPAMPTSSTQARRPDIAPEPPSPAIAMALSALGSQPSEVSDSTAAARDYFIRMQAIQTVGPTNDTGEFANKLMTASMNGDTSGFDDLVKVTQVGIARVRALTPPPCCVEYHQRLLAMLAESAAMVERLKGAISSGDAAALTALAASGASLQTRANALEDEAKLIKTKLGLAIGPH